MSSRSELRGEFQNIVRETLVYGLHLKTRDWVKPPRGVVCVDVGERGPGRGRGWAGPPRAARDWHRGAAGKGERARGGGAGRSARGAAGRTSSAPSLPGVSPRRLTDLGEPLDPGTPAPPCHWGTSWVSAHLPLPCPWIPAHPPPACHWGTSWVSAHLPLPCPWIPAHPPLPCRAVLRREVPGASASLSPASYPHAHQGDEGPVNARVQPRPAEDRPPSVVINRFVWPDASMSANLGDNTQFVAARF
uniref:Uncharacterized protein n=1 Tax=Rousettus aegyptiacus TaxID=9407 RepID=A0A7J8KBL7_ROUAE|nr:hypothetical protein HJG63_008053 [Rousettus aegyptiacus]